MKVRVTHFSNTGIYYVVQYKRHSLSDWTTLTRVNGTYYSTDIMERYHPNLMSFDEAKRVAKGLTVEKLDEIIASEDRRFAIAYAEQDRKEKEFRARSWEGKT